MSTANVGRLTTSKPYPLTNGRQDHFDSLDVDARRTFANGYTLFASYTRSSTQTNAALDFGPTVSCSGRSDAGRSPGTAEPSHFMGWLPLLVPKFKKSWDFVYTMN
jgi:hypothetical protein